MILCVSNLPFLSLVTLACLVFDHVGNPVIGMEARDSCESCELMSMSLLRIYLLLVLLTF